MVLKNWNWRIHQTNVYHVEKTVFLIQFSLKLIKRDQVETSGFMIFFVVKLIDKNKSRGDAWLLTIGKFIKRDQVESPGIFKFFPCNIHQKRGI